MRVRPCRHTVMLCLSFVVFLCACTEESLEVITGNTAPNTVGVPTIRIENYVNRLFIDLLGREPVPQEMSAAAEILRKERLSRESRLALIEKLQTSTERTAGDSSYLKAYHWRLYQLAKIRCIEGVSDRTLRVEFTGSEDYRLRVEALISSRQELEDGQIQLHQMFARMVDNPVYDLINMNSFNFVNATFDDLLWRFPTNSEFKAGFDMVENDRPAILFTRSGQNKGDYIEIITHSREMFEGLSAIVGAAAHARRNRRSAARLSRASRHQAHSAPRDGRG
jgi:hypothetical protein